MTTGWSASRSVMAHPNSSRHLTGVGTLRRVIGRRLYGRVGARAWMRSLSPTMARRTRTVWRTASLALIAALVVGCGGPSPTPSPTPTLSYTKAQADACATASIAIDFGGQAPKAETLYFTYLGDLTAARTEAATVAEKDAALVATFTGTGADAEVAALETALTSSAAAFALPMTSEQFQAAYKAIEDASRAFDSQCRLIGVWVENHVPQ